MYSDDRFGAGRVRHVPITIESRNNRTIPSESQAPQAGLYQNDHSQTRHNYHDHNIHAGHSNTLPNTSSVNINYRPPAPSRQSNQQHQQSNQQGGQRENQHGQSANARSSSTGPSSRQINEDNQNTEVRASSGSPSDFKKANSDKLLGSPEPIPLPPPEDQLGNCSGKAERQSETTNSNHDMPNPHPSNHPSRQQNHHQKPHKQPQQVNEEPIQRGSHQTQQTQNSNQKQTNMTQIDAARGEIAVIIREISSFEGDSQKSKEYRFLDEQLTRCVLNLDKIECGDCQQLRQQRKATIKLVDRATELLQKKQQLNLDTNNLSMRKQQFSSDIGDLLNSTSK